MYRYRIVTFVEEKERVFTVRKVRYEDGTPLYSIPNFHELKWTSLERLMEETIMKDSIILDQDFYLKIWNQDKDLIPLNHEQAT